MYLNLDLEIILKKICRAVCVLGLAVLLESCLGTRYLQENQKLLYRQTIKAPRGFNTDALEGLYVQKANRRLLGLPINTLVWMHHEGEIRYSKDRFIAKKERKSKKFEKKIKATTNPKRLLSYQFRKQRKIDNINAKIENGNLFMQWGEPASVYDSTSIVTTKEKLHDYLFTKGWFDNTITYRTSEFKKRMSVIYDVSPHQPYIYDSIFFDIADSVVFQYVVQSQPKSFLKPGDQYDQEKLTKERERLDLLLKDNGFYDFSRQYITFSVDSSFKKNRLALKVEIVNPAKRDFHKQFQIDSITFTTDVGVVSEKSERQTSRFENIVFNYFDYEYSKRILAQRVSINKDSLYNRSRTFNTQRQLANLDVFKFININYDTSGGRFIANIFSSPLDKFSWSNEAGVTVTQGFPGPYISTSFKKRNLFGGLEIFELNGRFGFEGVASAASESNFYRSTEAIANASVTFPQFLFPLSKAASFRYAPLNPRTKLLAGYAYTDRPEYQRSITTVSSTFSWEIPLKAQFSFTATNLSIIRTPFISTAFNERLIELEQNGNRLINAFKPSFVSSMIMAVTWNQNYGNAQKNSSFIRVIAESGGTLLNLYSPKVISNEGLEPFQFLRFSLDFRKNIIINKNTSLAYRVNTGIGYAYSDNKVLPYEKNFFVGGSNSVRAWRPRRLGPGELAPDTSVNIPQNGFFDYRFERPGDLLMEASVEYRQKLFGFVNYALFVDAGNVWAITNGSNLPSKFNGRTFVKQFGVGTGFGLRFDFTFLILRFDVGMKVWDPARPLDDRFVLTKARFFKPFSYNNEPVIFNVGIGYPF